MMTENQPINPLLFCAVGTWLCALPIAVVMETMRPLPIEAVARAPDFILGLAIIRGQPLPVVDLPRLLGTGTLSAGRFVTVRAGERRIACAVDAVIGVRHVPSDLLGRLPPLLDRSALDRISSIGALDRELLLVINAAHLAPAGIWSDLGVEGSRP